MNLELKPRRSEIDVLWDKPDGQTIVGYIVQYKKSDTLEWDDGKEEETTSTRHTIQGLHADTSYDVRVAATNDKGNGDFVSATTTTG